MFPAKMLPAKCLSRYTGRIQRSAIHKSGMLEHLPDPIESLQFAVISLGAVPTTIEHGI